MIVRVMYNIFNVKVTLVTKAVKLMYWLKSKIFPTEIDREVEMFLGKGSRLLCTTAVQTGAANS